MINVAIVFTLFRIVLTPFIVCCMLQQQYFFALFLFMCALITDVLDGFFARTFNQQTTFGAMLDPIADKILFGSVMICLIWVFKNCGFMYRFALYFLLIKETVLLVGSGMLWFFYKKFITPSKLSRFVSFCEALLLILLFLNFVVAVPAWIIFVIVLVNVFVSLWLFARYTAIVFFVSN